MKIIKDNIYEEQIDWNHRDILKKSPIFYANYDSSIDIYRILMERGAQL
jgi:hypothetical protein